MKKRYLVFFLAFVVVMSAVTIFGKNGLLHVFTLKGELNRLAEINESIRHENARLAEEINYLRNHEGYLEMQAHRQGLVKEDEIVFHFTDDQ